MTELAFHFGAPDKLAYTCRLLRKAASSGAKVVVIADADSIAKLDADLWAVSPTDFVAHCTNEATTAIRNRSPVLLASHTDQASAPFGVLVNLGDTVPQGFEKFERLIEVVSTDATDRELARGRWRTYTQQGYAITRHDLNVRRPD